MHVSDFDVYWLGEWIIDWPVIDFVTVQLVWMYAVKKKYFKKKIFRNHNIILYSS